MIDYRQSGVDVEEGYKAVSKYKDYAKRTKIPGVLSGLGSFAGMFEVPAGMKNPVMVSGTDGVGTKLDIACAMKKYDTVGIDCVAMCVNDILCTGARPLYFLDYIACGKLDAHIASDFVKGVSDGCIDSGCALLGGETAEMPGFYDEGKYDIAGFGVGIIEKDDIVNGDKITSGDVLIGLASTGVHSNGFSLVRKLVSDYSSPFAGKTIGDVLLTPTKIYVKPVLAVLEKYRKDVHGMVHITGGGFYENIPRMYPSDDEGYMNLISVIKNNSWKVPEIFGELIKRGANPDRMYNTFNMGIGFVMAVEASKAADIIEVLKKNNQDSYVIGRVEKSAQKIKEQTDAVVFEN